jgi:hypothetical protein
MKSTLKTSTVNAKKKDPRNDELYKRMKAAKSFISYEEEIKRIIENQAKKKKKK